MKNFNDRYVKIEDHKLAIAEARMSAFSAGAQKATLIALVAVIVTLLGTALLLWAARP